MTDRLTTPWRALPAALGAAAFLAGLDKLIIVASIAGAALLAAPGPAAAQSAHGQASKAGSPAATLRQDMRTSGRIT